MSHTNSRLALATALAASLTTSAVLAQEPAPDPHFAAQYFQEARVVSQHDGGSLWGKTLYGPMLFVDPATRSVVANLADDKAGLSRNGKVFTGTLPKGIGIANTDIEWAGVHWTMVVWPLPEDAHAREVLMMHECFHRLQQALVLRAPDLANDHLDTTKGRVWLQLEWRALEAALVGSGRSRAEAVRDALLFRAYRRSQFPAAAAAENALEIQEGLAQYTGVKAAARYPAEATIDAVLGLATAPRKPSFVRSFAYASGPAYGLLLDALSPGWRSRLDPRSDLGSILQHALSITLPADPRQEAEQRATEYGGADLRSEEAARSTARQDRVSSYRARFLTGPVLILPLRKISYSFDPNGLVPLGGIGTVYPWLNASDTWGTLIAKHGALITRNGSGMTGIRLSAPTEPSARPLKGDGWTLQLKPGWRVVPGPRKGDYTLQAPPSGKP